MDVVHKIAAELQGFSDSPLAEARLFCEVKNPSEDEIKDFIMRRKAGEPTSKIIGEKGFWKGIFNTNIDVLDPRSDSETLIETVLNYIPDKMIPLRMLDVGTGSGCLLISLLEEYPNAIGIGLDKSNKALAVAQSNKKNKTATFTQRDFMQPNWTEDLGQFDVIVSNPPYIKSAEIETLDVTVKKYDPILALDGGSDGLTAYRALALTLPALCHKGTHIFFEIGQGQETDVKELMEKSGFQFLSQHADLGGIIRILVFRGK